MSDVIGFADGCPEQFIRLTHCERVDRSVMHSSHRVLQSGELLTEGGGKKKKKKEQQKAAFIEKTQS